MRGQHKMNHSVFHQIWKRTAENLGINRETNISVDAILLMVQRVHQVL